MTGAPIPDGTASPTPSRRGPNSDDDTGPLLNPHVAIVLAIVPGLFGFLGIGQLYKREWGKGIGLLVLGWFFLAVRVAGLLQTLGVGALMFAVPIVYWPLALNPEGPLMTDRSAVGSIAYLVGSSLFYLLAWGGGIYYAWTGWTSPNEFGGKRGD